ncbi:T9SS type A sorting domain-containing protein [Flavobacterium sp.]|uniref:T9SS type A sorting domain-containing protein n=1 Tax=Flavobacterium sp. TaxID=239 RepID=UPI002488B46C|nr:T9SS type A sorting domain-containing protein [Flavobacterium sp.]MDI1317002.1 T9SS type A sorting domain-containing protein [Flavobacterium sp.]
MKKQLLHLFLVTFFAFNTKAQTISIIGSTTPSADWGFDIAMITTDNITYTLNNITVSDATDPTTTGLKFRLNNDWGTNWGNSNFPSGTAVQDGANILTQAGTYDITFNRNNGTYTFIPSTGLNFSSIGIWGPAVNSQQGFTAPDVDMTTTDGITYTLSGFNYSTGTAYFRENNGNTKVWGSVSFPAGIATLSGPSIQVTGGEWFVTFNRITGDYNFSLPSIGILGTALSGFTAEDIDLNTTDGFNYSISNLSMTDGEAKFRKDNLWVSNWGAADFPVGIGTQGGSNIQVIAGSYNITFEKGSGDYTFTNVLSNSEHSVSKINIYPNPTNNFWNLSHSTTIDSVELFDVNGKVIQSFIPNSNQFQLDGTLLSNGVYFLKIKSGLDFTVKKIIKN